MSIKSNTKKLIPDDKITCVIDKLEVMYPDAACELDYDSVFHLLIAVVLSAQTTDVSVNKVTPELFRRYPEASDLAAADVEEVEELIRSIGMYKNKARNIISLSMKLTEDYDGVVPSAYEELVSLPGVGRKTANVVLAEAFGEQRIAVDTHVFRVANRIGLCDETDVTSTEKVLMARLPEDRWTRVHHLLIFHGRRLCTARKPGCETCLLNDVCHKNNI